MTSVGVVVLGLAMGATLSGEPTIGFQSGLLSAKINSSGIRGAGIVSEISRSWLAGIGEENGGDSAADGIRPRFSDREDDVGRGFRWLVHDDGVPIGWNHLGIETYRRRWEGWKLCRRRPRCRRGPYGDSGTSCDPLAGNLSVAPGWCLKKKAQPGASPPRSYQIALRAGSSEGQGISCPFCIQNESPLRTILPEMSDKFPMRIPVLQDGPATPRNL